MRSKEDYAEYMREWYKKSNHSDKIKARVKNRAQTNQSWWNEFKRTVPPCSKCGESDWRCIDYHHIDPSTKETDRGGISQCPGSGWSIARILQEITKCIPVCANCHRLEHYNEPKNKGIKQRKPTPSSNELAMMSKERRYYWRHQEVSIERKERRIKELTEWFRTLKASCGCKICGETRYQCLDYHHLDGTVKSHQVSRMPWGSYSQKTILSEITKCELLCANCHRKEHYSKNI